MTGNLSASILARLLTLAKQRGDDYNLLLNRFGMERLLARVSMSPHADRFLLKGALLFALWYDTPHRPTKDADLLGFGEGLFPQHLHLQLALEGLLAHALAVAALRIIAGRGRAAQRVHLPGLPIRHKCHYRARSRFRRCRTSAAPPRGWPSWLRGVP